jgi:hypothetical protein
MQQTLASNLFGEFKEISISLNLRKERKSDLKLLYALSNFKRDFENLNLMK